MNPPPVILLHGLLNHPVWMAGVARGLRGHGRTVFNLGYPSRRSDIKTISTLVWRRVQQRFPDTPVDFVTHSMGGIVARQIDADQPGAIHRMVMLAPPNQGAELADVVRRSALLRWIIGPAGLEIGCGPESTPNRLGTPGCEVGVIAGSKPDNPLSGRWIPSEEDGRVSVARTALEGMACRIVLPYGHFPMLWKRRVIEEVACFLEKGRFQDQDKTRSPRRHGEHREVFKERK